MATINYDRAVKDLIAGLNRTGHVTHRSYRKTSVTLHHNAARLSHQGVLNVWKSRPASAHFNVDSRGTVAQYVKANEYAWACGSTRGNQTSISIEMCNQTLAPGWDVSDTTWRSAARLAGWLFANVIGARPTNNNLLRHKYWYATACAGPDIDDDWAKVLAEAQRSYDAFKGRRPAPTPNTDTEWMDAMFANVSKFKQAVINATWGDRFPNPNSELAKKNKYISGYTYLNWIYGNARSANEKADDALKEIRELRKALGK